MESLFLLPASEGARKSRKCAPKYPKPQWEAIKPKIQQLYIQEWKTAKEVLAILKQEDGFVASYVVSLCLFLKFPNEAEIPAREKQIKKKIAEWALNIKNVKRDTMIEMWRTSVKRKRWEGKESTFTINGDTVAPRKINRFAKRNKLSEEELLSSESPIDGWLYLSLHNDILTLHTAPSPEFRVSTPLPDSPSNIRIQRGHSRGDPIPFQNQYLSSVVSSDWWDPDESPMSNDPAHSSHQQTAHCTSDMSVALTPSQNKSLASRRDTFFGSVPRPPQNRPESPELLLMRFRDRICPLLSSADGQQNLWETLVLHLVHDSDSPSLYEAISAVTALKVATDARLVIHGISSMDQSLISLNGELSGPAPSVTTLATVLLLAFWTRWDEGLHKGKVHIKGALALFLKVWSQYAKQPLEHSPGDSYSLLAFLHDTCSRMDSLSRLVRAVMATDQYEASKLPAFEELHPKPTLPRDSLTDPWMGCVRRLFPLISRTADFCNEARSISIYSPDMTKKAAALKCEIEAWRPDTDILCRAGNSAVDIDHMLHTAEAYRYATLLYLGQVVPKLAGDCQQMSGNIVARLDSVPLHSRMTVVHIFPLFIAGCEACTEEERQWVEKRWAAMRERIMVKNVEKCWEITQEVWRRRDKSSVDHQQWAFDCEGEISEEMDPEFSVRGRLPWAMVMMDWGWEVSF